MTQKSQESTTTMVWGSSALRSCTSLIDRVDQNDSSLKELVILSTKTVSPSDWDRLTSAITKHGKDRKLKSLQASGHEISCSALHSLGKAIHESSKDSAWSLLAVGNKDMGASGGLEHLVQGLDSPAEELKLQKLDLSYKGLGRKNVGPILDLTGRCQKIKSLILSRNSGLMNDLADDEGLASKAMFPFIEELDLASVEMDSKCAKLLFQGLASSSSCRDLNISNNPMGTMPFDILSTCPASVKNLNLSGCSLGDETFASLMQSNTQLASLHTLDLSNNQFTAFSMKTFAKWLVNGCPALRNLNISGNPLRTEGVATLVQEGLIPRDDTCCLTSLDLGETQCQSEGAIIAIQSSSVKSLRLFKNDLGSEGFVAMAPCLVGGHGSLETLDLAANAATEEAVVTLLQGLAVVGPDGDKSSLKTIVVGGNMGGTNVEQVVKQILQVRPKLDIARDKVKER